MRLRSKHQWVLEAIIASLKPRTQRALSREIRTKALLSASSEAILASLEVRTLLPSSGRAKALSAQVASPCEANSQGEAILTSPMAKKKASTAKSRSFLRRLTFSLPESLCWISWVQSTQTYKNI